MVGRPLDRILDHRIKAMGIRELGQIRLLMDMPVKEVLANTIQVEVQLQPAVQTALDGRPMTLVNRQIAGYGMQVCLIQVYHLRRIPAHPHRQRTARYHPAARIVLGSESFEMEIY